MTGRMNRVVLAIYRNLHCVLAKHDMFANSTTYISGMVSCSPLSSERWTELTVMMQVIAS